VAERSVEFGIAITAKDNTTAGVNKARRGFDRLRAGVHSAATKASNALIKLGGAVTAVNQAFEFGKTAVEIATAVYDRFVAKALEQRDASDQQARDMKALGLETERVAGLIGDFLIPVILGISDALGPATSAWRDYLKANRAAFGADAVADARGYADVLVDVVGGAVKWITRAWMGVNTVVDGLIRITAEYYSRVLAGASSMISTFASLAEAVGADGLAGSLTDARDNVRGLSDDLSAGAGTYDDWIAQTTKAVAEQAELEDGVDKLGKTVKHAIADVATKVINRFRQSIHKIDRSLRGAKTAWEHFMDRFKRDQSAIQGMFQVMADADAHTARLILDQNLETVEGLRAAWADYHRFRLTLSQKSAHDVSEALVAAQAEQKAAADESASSLASSYEESFTTVAGIIRGSFQEAFVGIGQDGKTLGDAMSALLEGIGKRALSSATDWVVAEGIKAAATRAAAALDLKASAAEGGGRAIAAHADIPFVGLAIGLGISAAVVAAILGLANFHEGGFIGSGDRNGEVLALLKRGEYVAPPGAPAAAAATAAALVQGGHGASGGSPTSGGSVFAPQVMITLFDATDMAEAERRAQERLLPMFQRWARDGKLAQWGNG